MITSIFGSSGPLWYESMQDMSGYVQADITSHLLDEQINVNISTAQIDSDFYVQNSEIPPSTEEFILGDQTEAILGDKSIMFNCPPRVRTDKWLLESSTDNINNLMSTKVAQFSKSDDMDFLSRNLPPQNRNSFTAVVKKKTQYLSISEEEPLIKDDLETFHDSSKLTNMDEAEFIHENKQQIIKEDPCNDLWSTNKRLTYGFQDNINVSEIFGSEENNIKEDSFYHSDSMPYNFKDDIDVVEEVVVTTEELDESKAVCTYESSNLETPPHQVLIEPDFEVPTSRMEEPPLDLDELSQFGFENHFDICEMINSVDDSYLCDGLLLDLMSPKSPKSEPPILDLMSPQTSKSELPLRTTRQTPPPLTLDIEAASTANIFGKTVTDTPELLNVLKPADGQFDLVKFITTTGNPNTTTISPTTETCLKTKPEKARRGKSRLSMKELKQAQLGRGKPSFVTVDPDVSPSFSRLSSEHQELNFLSQPSTSTGRPVRKSASKFNKMIEEGFLCSTIEPQSVCSEDEDEMPKRKRRRTTSTSSCRSNLSSIEVDAMKYRERRDRNNLSSKRSRQKRKVQFQQKQTELFQLEEENARLKRKKQELEVVLNKVKSAWALHLARLTKESDKD